MWATLFLVAFALVACCGVKMHQANRAQRYDEAAVYALSGFAVDAMYIAILAGSL